MLDFVPNHMTLDHPWTDAHPDYFVHASEDDLARAPQKHCRAETNNGPLLLAHGRDPYFDGWPDTLQLDYGNAGLRASMIGELKRIAGQCDGVRCDMAMLVLPEVFERAPEGIRAEPFWPKAIETVRGAHPGLLFMAEVYWDMESALQQQGFDYAYDKRACMTACTSGAPALCASPCARKWTTRTGSRASWRTTTNLVLLLPLRPRSSPPRPC